MSFEGDGILDSFGRWVELWFLGAGVLWLLTGLISAIHTEVDEVFNVHLGDPAGVMLLLAIIVSFGCIIGMYPRIADRAPRSAQAGVLFGAFTFVSQVVWLIVSGFTLTWPTHLASELGYSSLLSAYWAVGLVVYPIAFAILGIASVRTGVFSRFVSYLLIVPLVIWVIGAGASQYLGDYAGPLGSAGVTPLAMAAVFLAVGYRLEPG